MIKKMMLLPLLAFSLNMTQPVHADEVKSPAATSTPKSCACAHPVEKLAKTLNLDNNQVTQIKTIKANARTETKANLQKLRAVRQQIKALTFSGKIDEAQLDNLINQKTAILAAMTKTRVMSKNAIYNTLNAKQQAAFKDMMSNWKNESHKKCPCKAKAA